MWHLTPSAEYGMLETLLMAVAGLWRKKLAKQKNSKQVGKSSHVSITKSQKIDTFFFF